MRISNAGLLAGGGVAACAACCAAPLLPGSLFAIFGLSGASFAEWGEQGFLVAITSLGVAYLLWRWFAFARRASRQDGCGRTAEFGKNANIACDLAASEVRGTRQVRTLTTDKPSLQN